MFAKLLKYEWKANVKLLSLLSACVLGVGYISAIVLRLLTQNWGDITESDTGILLMIPSFIFLFLAYLGVLLYSASVQYILLFRFYRSRFSDEGYLMFTLPVKTSHLFLSNAVHMMIWSAISVTVVILSLVIAIGFGPVWPKYASITFKSAFIEISSVFKDLANTGYIITGLLSVVIMWVHGIITPMSAVVLGASVAKKHKVLAIIGILVGLSMVTSIASGIVTGIAQVISITSRGNIEFITTITPLLNCIVPLGFTIGGYFLSLHIMKRRLNLP